MSKFRLDAVHVISTTTTASFVRAAFALAHALAHALALAIAIAITITIAITIALALLAPAGRALSSCHDFCLLRVGKLAGE